MPPESKLISFLAYAAVATLSTIVLSIPFVFDLYSYGIDTTAVWCWMCLAAPAVFWLLVFLDHWVPLKLDDKAVLLYCASVVLEKWLVTHDLKRVVAIACSISFMLICSYILEKIRG